ncbi:uncharacterized protein LOC127840389 [Dreissena polymorpha]|nr:uncharacterized protein LOC127840389 [Dreissena polymorpha]
MVPLKNQLQRSNSDEDNSDKADPTSNSSTEQSLIPWVWKSCKRYIPKFPSWPTQNAEQNTRITEIENELQLLRQESREVRDSLHKINNEIIQQTAALDELKEWKVKSADTESLKQVLILLKTIQKNVGRLVMFWESMTDEVLNLKEVLNFGQKIQVQQTRDRFKGYETDCRDLTTKFKAYVRDCEMGIGNLYNFLYMSDDNEETSEFDMGNRHGALPAI